MDPRALVVVTKLEGKGPSTHSLQFTVIHGPPITHSNAQFLAPTSMFATIAMSTSIGLILSVVRPFPYLAPCHHQHPQPAPLPFELESVNPTPPFVQGWLSPTVWTAMVSPLELPAVKWDTLPVFFGVVGCAQLRLLHAASCFLPLASCLLPLASCWRSVCRFICVLIYHALSGLPLAYTVLSSILR
jgi:hypothetical protein